MKFRKKPVVIEAEQFFAQKPPWPQGVIFKPKTKKIQWCGKYMVETLEGWLRVRDGDWIITGVKGERYPVKDEIFKATYEPVES